MISQNDYYGGGSKVTITADLYIGRYSPRIHAITTATASLKVYLPNVPEFDGRYLIISNESASTENLEVRQRDETVEYSALAPGESIKLVYAHNATTSANKWTTRLLSFTNDVTPLRSSITDPATDTQLDDTLLTYADLYGSCSDMEIIPDYDDDQFEPICISEASATLSLWDNDSVDGDAVSVYVNDVLVIDDVTLDGPGNKTVQAISIVEGWNTLRVYITSHGAVAPATVSVTLTNQCDGTTFSGTLNNLNTGEDYTWLIWRDFE